jgi:FkbM family methyltransferase
MDLKNKPSLLPEFIKKPYGFMKPFWFEPAKHIYRLLFDDEYRRYSWLLIKYGRTPRYRQRIVRLGDLRLTVPDMASFFSAYKEIFVENIYEFPSTTEAPVILDCGANIGLSILYFKKRYPKSKVVAYEADPNIFKILQMNLQINNITNIELHNEAVWSSQSTIEFSREGADGGRIKIGLDRNITKVPAVSLISILQSRRFEFIKIDIEGAETDSLRGCEKYLKDVDYVFVEFHSFMNKKQGLGELISAFELLGFRVYVHLQFSQKRPFCEIRNNLGMDMQLNLFFIKDHHENI